MTSKNLRNKVLRGVRVWGRITGEGDFRGKLLISGRKTNYSAYTGRGDERRKLEKGKKEGTFLGNKMECVQEIKGGKFSGKKVLPYTKWGEEGWQKTKEGERGGGGLGRTE